MMSARSSAACAIASSTSVTDSSRVVGKRMLASALVVNRDGSIAGFQDKVQVDPSEDAIYFAWFGQAGFRGGRAEVWDSDLS